MAYSSFFGSFRKTRFVIGALLAAQLSNTSPKLATAELPAASQPAQKSFDDHLVQANALFKAGKLGESLAEVQAAAKVDPNRYEAPATAALILHAAGKPAEAKGALDAAMKLASPDKQEKVQNIAKLLASIPARSGSPTDALTGPARRQLDILLLIVEEADKVKTDDERKRLLREFLDKSDPFLKEHPNQLPVWTLRAAAALELNDEPTGRVAGKQMVRLGADEAEELKMRKVMAMLERKTWIKSAKKQAEENRVEEQRAADARGRKVIEQTLLAKAWANSLGMKFLPVPNTKVQFCIWETRVQDYSSFVKDTGRAWVRPAFPQEDSHPAVNVSWSDARAFCEWISRKEGMSYRLPTDTEWSYAVGIGEREKGSTPSQKDRSLPEVYPWGTQWPPPSEAGNYSVVRNVDSFETTSPAGSFAANEHGLYDLSGNAWEWCEDWYDAEEKYRVLRGGSWGDGGLRIGLSSSYRFTFKPEDGSRYIGFRVVLVGK